MFFLFGGKVKLYNNGVNNGFLIPCDYCKKIIFYEQSRFKKNITHCCSRQCSFNLKSFNAHEYRVCEICQKDYYVKKISKQRFCSVDCQNEWQKTKIGMDNPRCTSQYIKCDYCGTEYLEKQYKIRNKQKHFCSKECRVFWYSEVFSQNKKWKEESRIRAVKILESGKVNTMTKPQIIVNNLLKNLNVSFINEKGFKYYSVDNYLNEYNLIIEVMGDYWHCSPLKFKLNSNSFHFKNVRKDKAKHTYIKKYYDIEILYLWEKDIYENDQLCKKIIEEYIRNNGVLKNYHSFNYYLKDGDLCLRENIIKSYAEN